MVITLQFFNIAYQRGCELRYINKLNPTFSDNMDNMNEPY